jgi:hypothetical protein
VYPIVTIVSVLAGAALLGILGALLAIPVAAAFQILLKGRWAHRGPTSPATADATGSVTRSYGRSPGPYRNRNLPAQCSPYTQLRKEKLVSYDVKIEDDIRGALARDRRIPSPDDVAISSVDGTVVLRGTVGSFGQRHAAVSDARHVEGVHDVDDHLQVRILDADRRADADIRDVALETPFIATLRSPRTSST